MESLKNKSKYKRKIKLFAITSILLALGIVINLIMLAFSTYSYIIKRNIENRQHIDLPQNIKCTYHTNNVAWDGFGEIYTVFKLKENTSGEFINYILAWDGKKYGETEVSQMKTVCEKDFKNALKQFNDIPAKYHPKWNEEFYFIHRVHYISNFGIDSINLFIGISIIYIPSTLELFIFEIFS